ncbi:MAG: rRNA methyltransferase [Flavobacteriaceae bacterium]|nr:rRNA methyltransferase [Flavobacteriaceae bacterium]
MFKEITSIQNPIIKRILLLKDKAKQRNIEGVFVIEGQRELGLAIKGGYVIKSLLFEPNLFDESRIDVYKTKETEIIQINSRVYNKIVYRGSTEGVVAIAESKSHKLEDLKLGSSPLILVAEAPEKPGNIGALLRTADAAHVDAVIIANPRTDLYNSNVIRSSVGGLFTVSIAVATSEETIGFLNQRSIPIYSAVLQESIPYIDIDFGGASALVVGPESTGLSEIWRSAADKKIQIPMLGDLDSMNVSVAAGILLFEAKRQRKFLL